MAVAFGSVSIGFARLFIADLRVEHDLEKIDEQIQKHDQRGVKEDGADDQSVVAIEGGLNEETSEAGDVENGFDNERAADETGGGRSEKGDDRQDPDAESVFEDDDRFLDRKSVV